MDWAGLEPAILSEYGPEPYAYAIPPPVHQSSQENGTDSTQFTLSLNSVSGIIAPVKSFDKLVRVIAKLRSPKGCPWDRKQTHATLIKYLFEEAKELKSSIRKKDFENLKEELGDVLLQVVLHSQLAREKGRFSIDDVINEQVRKLTLRHPHVFGFKREHKKLLKGRSFRTSQDVLDNWDLLKKISARR